MDGEVMSASHEGRLTKVETNLALLQAGIESLAGDFANFRSEWSGKAEEDRRAHRASRMTFPQIIAMLVGTVTMTAVLLGGLMFLINSQISTVRLDLASQLAQIGLTVRGQGDSVTNTQTAIQLIQREQAGDRVKLGLVEQASAANSKFIDQAQSFDATMARHEEKLKAMEQFVRDMAARRPP